VSPLVAPPLVPRVQRLALGLELVDADRGDRVAHPVSVAIDGVPHPLPSGRAPRRAGGLEVADVLPRVDRHESCLHALVYRRGLYRPEGPGGPAFVTLRFLSPDRRYVPRRLRFTLLDPADLEAADEADPPAGDPAELGRMRVRRVTLFGGAAYDAPPAVTGLRGRARRAGDGSPARWVRVEAWTQDAFGGRVALVGRAQGDDRGEFLLLVRPGAAGVGPLDLVAGLSLVIDVHAPPVPAGVPPAVRANDPLWDLPVESVGGPGPADPVSLGERIPAGSTTASRVETFTFGQFLTSRAAPFVV
jgi:hypothetical protein